MIYLAPILAVVALLFAAYKTAFVSKADAGTERMREIAASINEGARAFLFAEYRILVIFIVVLFLLIGVLMHSWVTAICFLCGALFSILAGYIGMNVATKANVRTANAARESGMNKALSIAFSGGREGDWGYGNTVKDEAEFLERFDRITTAIKQLPYVSGYCYTQVSDVQQEINGLLDENHEFKIAPEKIREINCREVGMRRISRE